MFSQSLIHPPANTRSRAPLRIDGWGYDDTRFVLGQEQAPVLLGNRYALCGTPLPGVLPWLNAAMGIDFQERLGTLPRTPQQRPQMAHVEPALPEEVMTWLAGTLKEDQWTTSTEARFLRATGQVLGEKACAALPRLPDLVCFPSTDAEVLALTVGVGQFANVRLMPYGGGTNVAKMLSLEGVDPKVMVLAIDMERMRSVRWIDPINRLACVEAGIRGGELQECLQAEGFTLGHEPDSFEFSTLGGWIATKASGMKQNRYGNIEDMLVSVIWFNKDGRVEKFETQPRTSTGRHPNDLILGSEGKRGVIAYAVVKIHPVPEEQRYDSVLLPDYETGIRFLHAVRQAGLRPASIRLVDNEQFRFGRAFKPPENGWGAGFKSAVEKWVVTQWYGFDPNEMAAVTLVYEGSAAEVDREAGQVGRLTSAFGGVRGGGHNGKTGYQLTFAIAYIRDLASDLNVFAESFETSVAWEKALPMIQAVQQTVLAKYGEYGVQGTPMLSSRISQSYDSGVCVYFYLGILGDGLDSPTKTYFAIEHACRATILAFGGSLSHHHGIGQLRSSFAGDLLSPAAKLALEC